MPSVTRFAGPAILALLVGGCGAGPAPPGKGTARAAAPGAGEIGQASIHGLYDEPVRLTGGEWEGEPYVSGGAARPRAGLLRDFLLSGDLDGDGDDESVALVWRSSGGSGTFDYVAVFDRTAPGVVNVATAALGDRVQVRAGRIEEGRIVLDVVQADDDDAACCPTALATRTWSLDAGALRETPVRVTGTLSLAELAGVEWRLERLTQDGPTMRPVVTLRFDEGQARGRGPCNRYTAALSAGEAPGQLTFGPIGATRMHCTDVMDLEHRYLRALGAVHSYGFLAGRLALTWISEDASGTLLFARAGPAADE